MRIDRFQMLDRVAPFDPVSGSFTAHARVPARDPVFEGHFPGHALMPGVLLLEAMAQASGYLLLALDGFSRMPFLAGAKEANFRAFVAPGTDLCIEAERVHAGSGYAVTSSRILRGGDRVCDARLTFRIVPFPVPSLERFVRAEGERLGLLRISASAG